MNQQQLQNLLQPQRLNDESFNDYYHRRSSGNLFINKSKTGVKVNLPLNEKGMYVNKDRDLTRGMNKSQKKAFKKHNQRLKLGLI